ncbi:MAG: ABC transporter ATP-binding protein [Anaerolineales bacterium]|nr:ABC transporter ATP-binding protein [Anaerolineales bacterium]
MIEIEQVHFRYPNGVHALRGVSLSLTRGCVCLLGHNGAGKTTLFRHLNGLLKPSQGRVMVAGRDTGEHRAAQLASTVGLAFQNPDSQLFQDRVGDEVRFGARNGVQEHGDEGAMTEWAMDLMGLHGLAEQNPYDLLLPERKRVAVASVLAMDTPAVVLDEPTGGQDAEGVELLGRAVDELLSRDKLVVVATHDIEFAAVHADQVVVMSNGQVVRRGSPEDAFGDEDALRAAGVAPPSVTRLADALGAEQTIVSDDGFLRWLSGQVAEVEARGEV